MRYTKYANAVEWFSNVVEVLGVVFILLAIAVMQFVFHELPCPLCLLQRLGLFMAALGFLMNMRYGFHPSHYSMVLLGALFTCLVSLRQIALHIIPGTGWFGSPIMGFHLYTWSFIVSVIIMAVTSILLGADRQLLKTQPQSKSFVRMTNILFVFLLGLVALNLLSVFLQCGLTTCPDNPSQYFI